jgi:hypothetical protein
VLEACAVIKIGIADSTFSSKHRHSHNLAEPNTKRTRSERVSTSRVKRSHAQICRRVRGVGGMHGCEGDRGHVHSAHRMHLELPQRKQQPLPTRTEGAARTWASLPRRLRDIVASAAARRTHICQAGDASMLQMWARPPSWMSVLSTQKKQSSQID